MLLGLGSYLLLDDALLKAPSESLRAQPVFAATEEAALLVEVALLVKAPSGSTATEEAAPAAGVLRCGWRSLARGTG